MASPKEKIKTAALSSFRTVEVDVGAEKVVLRELSDAQHRQLLERNYQVKDGEFETDAQGNLIPLPGTKNYREQWIAATIEPEFSVEEILEWPSSLREKLYKKSRDTNGVESAEAVAKNS